MNKPITIIWSGNVWKFVSGKLSADYSVDHMPAREICGVSGILTNRFADKIARIFSDRETVRSLVEKVKNWEPVVFAGKNGSLLDQLIHTIESECPEQISHFYILGVNGFQLYGNAPRLVLNHAIKEKQVKGEEVPTPFTHIGKSYLYQPHPSDFDKELVKSLGFDMELTSDENTFLKALYLKCCINTIYNSICICNGPYIEAALQKFSLHIDMYISELYKVVNHLSPGLLSEEEIRREVYCLKERVPYTIPSSVNQFWRVEDGKVIADYQNSDIPLLLGWALQYAQKNNLQTPMLLKLMSEIVGRGNRANGIHLGNDNRTFFGLPAKEWQHPILINTGVR